VAASTKLLQVGQHGVEAQNAFGAKLRRQYECAIDGSGQVVNESIVE